MALSCLELERWEQFVKTHVFRCCISRRGSRKLLRGLYVDFQKNNKNFLNLSFRSTKLVF